MFRFLIVSIVTTSVCSSPIAPATSEDIFYVKFATTKVSEYQTRLYLYSTRIFQLSKKYTIKKVYTEHLCIRHYQALYVKCIYILHVPLCANHHFTQGDVIMESKKDWAPIGVHRLHTMVSSGFFSSRAISL